MKLQLIRVQGQGREGQGSISGRHVYQQVCMLPSLLWWSLYIRPWNEYLFYTLLSTRTLYRIDGVRLGFSLWYILKKKKDPTYSQLTQTQCPWNRSQPQNQPPTGWRSSWDWSQCYLSKICLTFHEYFSAIHMFLSVELCILGEQDEWMDEIPTDAVDPLPEAIIGKRLIQYSTSVPFPHLRASEK